MPELKRENFLIRNYAQNQLNCVRFVKKRNNFLNTKFLMLHLYFDYKNTQILE